MSRGQAREAAAFHEEDGLALPEGLDYRGLPGLSTEERERLSATRCAGPRAARGRVASVARRSSRPSLLLAYASPSRRGSPSATPLVA